MILSLVSIFFALLFPFTFTCRACSCILSMRLSHSDLFILSAFHISSSPSLYRTPSLFHSYFSFDCMANLKFLYSARSYYHFPCLPISLPSLSFSPPLSLSLFCHSPGMLPNNLFSSFFIIFFPLSLSHALSLFHFSPLLSLPTFFTHFFLASLPPS